MASLRTDVTPWAFNLHPNPIWLGGSDFNVGMDIDPSNGNALLTWYSFPANSSSYTHQGSYITFNGDAPVPQPATNIAPALCPTDIATYSVASQYGPYARLIGEYHDVSFSNGTFKSVNIHVEGSTCPAPAYGDPWLLKINYTP